VAKDWIITPYDDNGYCSVARLTNTLTYTGGVVSASAGRLLKVTVTTAFVGASGVLTFYDNAGAASGTPLLAIPVAQGVSGAVFTIDLPVVNGIFAGNASLTAGGVTVGYA